MYQIGSTSCSYRDLMIQKKIAYTDEDLVNLFRNPERKEYAFNLLVDRYKERLYRHIRKLVIDHNDTDDLLQETFISVWRGLGKFRGDSQLFTWLYRIATNEAFRFLEKKRKRILLPLVKIERQLSEKLKDDNMFHGDTVQMKLQQAILTLPEKQRVVFNLKYFDEMKYEDMAEVLNTSVGALKASYHHAVKKIEKYMTDD